LPTSRVFTRPKNCVVWTKDVDEHFIPVIYIDLLQKGKGPLKCSHPQSKAEFTILRLDLLPPFGSSQKVVASFCYENTI